MQYKAIINGELIGIGNHINDWQAYMFVTCIYGAESSIKIIREKIRIKNINIELPEILKTQA